MPVRTFLAVGLGVGECQFAGGHGCVRPRAFNALDGAWRQERALST